MPFDRVIMHQQHWIDANFLLRVLELLGTRSASMPRERCCTWECRSTGRSWIDDIDLIHILSAVDIGARGVSGLNRGYRE